MKEIKEKLDDIKLGIAIIWILLIIIIFNLAFSGCAHASSTLKENIILAIIGEAADQMVYGQIAVACGIKNRPEGLQGVYGKDMTRMPSEKEFMDASLALQLATPKRCYNLIGDADMWHSNYPAPKSWRGIPMIFITQIGDHYFYRRLTKGSQNAYHP